MSAISHWEERLHPWPLIIQEHGGAAVPQHGPSAASPGLQARGQYLHGPFQETHPAFSEEIEPATIGVYLLSPLFTRPSIFPPHSVNQSDCQSSLAPDRASSVCCSTVSCDCALDSYSFPSLHRWLYQLQAVQHFAKLCTIYRILVLYSFRCFRSLLKWWESSIDTSHRPVSTPGLMWGLFRYHSLRFELCLTLCCNLGRLCCTSAEGTELVETNNTLTIHSK